MLEIKNTEVFGLERALVAAGNPMTLGEICTNEPLGLADPKHLGRGKKLGSAPVGSAHDHFLVGIHVQFDIKYPQYWTIEAERYHNFEIISSQSKMHRLTMMGTDCSFSGMFNKYVDQRIIDIVQQKIDKYNSLVPHSVFRESIYTAFMDCISNLPMGFEMWMTCSLTYLQIKTMYMQRRNHKLKEDWGAFCDWCESLPRFKELIGLQNI